MNYVLIIKLKIKFYLPIQHVEPHSLPR